MDKRYQVFVTSTYAVRAEQLQRIAHAMMCLGCNAAPADMPEASDDERWEDTKRAINDCDYLLAIVGGPHDPVTAEEVARAEREYEYATARGVEVVALVRQGARKSPTGGPDTDPAARQRLKSFRGKLTARSWIWRRDEELAGLVALGLSRAIQARPAAGWVRGDLAATADVLAELERLRRQVATLERELSRLQTGVAAPVKGLAALDEAVTLRMRSKIRTHPQWQAWAATAKWRDIFGRVGPYLLTRRDDLWVKDALAEALSRLSGKVQARHELDDEDFQTIKVQLRALGLVELERAQTPRGRAKLLWSLTPRGELLLLQLRSVHAAPVERLRGACLAIARFAAVKQLEGVDSAPLCQPLVDIQEAIDEIEAVTGGVTSEPAVTSHGPVEGREVHDIVPDAGGESLA